MKTTVNERNNFRTRMMNVGKKRLPGLLLRASIVLFIFFPVLVVASVVSLFVMLYGRLRRCKEDRLPGGKASVDKPGNHTALPLGDK